MLVLREDLNDKFGYIVQKRPLLRLLKIHVLPSYRMTLPKRLTGHLCALLQETNWQ
jgi:hypothetical protein